MPKRNSLLFVFVSLVLALSSLVAASSYTIEINQVNSKLLVKHIVLLETESEMTFDIPADANAISSKQTYSLDGHTLTISGKTAELSYLTEEALQKSGSEYYYVENMKFNFSVDTVELKFILDRGYSLDKERIFPQVSKIESDGAQISALWELRDVKSGDDLPIFLKIEAPGSAGVPLGVIFAALLLVAAYLFYRAFRKKPKKDDVERHLMESEKAVMHELKQADRGELWQKQLQLSTGFSKAKLSRLVRNLEQRNLVDKIPFGNTNKVRLK